MNQRLDVPVASESASDAPGQVRALAYAAKPCDPGVGGDHSAYQRCGLALMARRATPVVAVPASDVEPLVGFRNIGGGVLVGSPWVTVATSS